MVWKSKRWQTKVSKVDGEGLLANSENSAPQPLEITYFRPEHGEVEELVYEDLSEHTQKKDDSAQQARLLVPLFSVLKLKELCEHEHARYDIVVETLSKCRSDYLKELSWLREQLHLLRRTGPEFLAWRSELKDEDFEVRWFDPPKYIDPELKAFLQQCIADNMQHLNKEIERLRRKVEDFEEREKNRNAGGVKPILRELLQGNKPGFLLSELNDILRKEEDIADLERVAKNILREAFVPPEPVHVEPQVIVKTVTETVQDPALLKEVEALRKKSVMDEMMVKQLKESLDEALDSRMAASVERERAEAEKARADAQEARTKEERKKVEEAQHHAHREKKRAEEFQLKCEKLQAELAQAAAKIPSEKTKKVTESVQRLSTAIGSLTSTFGSGPGAAVAGLAKSEKVSEYSFDEAVTGLNTLAKVFEETVPRTLQEFEKLKREHEAAKAQHQADAKDVEAIKAQHAREMEAAKAAAEADASKAAAEVHSKLEAKLKQADGENSEEIKKLEVKVDDLTSQLEKEQQKTKSFAASVEDLESKNATLCQKVQLYKQKAEDARRSLKRAVSDEADDTSESDMEDDEEIDDDMRFLISYTRRVKRLSAAGKRRWQMLSEDADLARQKREWIMGQRRSSIAPKQEELPDPQQMALSLRQDNTPSSHQMVVSRQHDEVKAAFSFLTASRSASSFDRSGHTDRASAPVISVMSRHPALDMIASAPDFQGFPLVQSPWPDKPGTLARTAPPQSFGRSHTVEMLGKRQTDPVQIVLVGNRSQPREAMQSDNMAVDIEQENACRIQQPALDLKFSEPSSEPMSCKLSESEERPVVKEEPPALQMPSYEGPLSARLVETFWSSGGPPTGEWMQGPQSPESPPSTIQVQPGGAVREDTSAKLGSFESYRSALSDKRQGQLQATARGVMQGAPRKTFRETWHGVPQKGAATAAASWQSTGAPKTPRVGDSLPELLSGDRSALSPVKSRLPPAVKALEERHGIRSKVANKLNKTSSIGWIGGGRSSPNWPTRVPLTNAGRAAHQHYASVPDLRCRATGDAFLPEVLPPLPPGRQLKTIERSYLPGLSSSGAKVGSE